MDKLLVTGITGFIGVNLKSYVEGAYQCVGVSRVSSKEKGLKSYESIGVQDFNEVKAVIHLAGKAHDLKNESSADVYFEVNRDLTVKLFDLFVKSSCEKFVYFSSVKAAADIVDGVLTEDAVPTPETPYGRSKLEAEQYILSQKLPANKKVYILRPCMVHGPYNKGNLNLLYKFVSKGVPYPLGAFENKRSFTSIENLCFIVKECIEKDIPIGIYNTADDEPLSTNALVKLIGDVIERPSKIWKVPEKIIYVVAKVGDFLHLPLNSHRLNKLTEDYVVSNKKIKEALSIGLPVTAVDGLTKTIKSF